MQEFIESHLKNSRRASYYGQIRVVPEKTSELRHLKHQRTFWKIYLLGPQFPIPSKYDYNLGNDSIQE